ncbi:hypothetical protein [Nocardia sp. NPDC004604]|uniref:hypothetical protein n=1 Tax=Nocardia sp. NPDC004604 TaxID=3157013 RepID=UPI0033BA391C
MLADPGIFVTVKAVYDTVERAEMAVARLNGLPVAGPGRPIYFWQMTRHVQDGPDPGGLAGPSARRPGTGIR